MNNISFDMLPQAVAELQRSMNEIKQLLQKESTTPPPESYITRKEAANNLCITLPTLTKWTLEGKLRGYRIGRRVLYKKNEVDQAVSSINTKGKNK